MSAGASAAAALEQQVAHIARERGIPGVSGAVLAGGVVTPFVHGVLDHETSNPVAVGDQVPIASITKVFTATVVMLLVDAGLIDLDGPLRVQLPMPHHVSAGPVGRATPRQLLTHSSGIEGDFFLDAGESDDAVERYVAACGALRSVHPPDLAASYCNTGMVLLSRVVESALGCPWTDAVHRMLTGPAGVPDVQAVDRGPGGGMVGHVGPPTARKLAPPRPFPRAVAAAGGMWASPTEVLTLVTPLLAGGQAAARRLGISAATLAEMQRDQVKVPGPAWLLCPSSWGLGWSTYRWTGGQVIGHDGDGAGTSSFLRAVPEAGVAVVLVANVGDCGPELGVAVASAITELTGLRPPSPLAPVPDLVPGVDLATLRGWYVGSSESYLVTDRNGRLEIRSGPWDAVPSPVAEPESLEPADGSGRHWVAPSTPAFRMTSPVTFTDLPDGRTMLHRFGRVAVASPVGRR